MLLMMMFSMFLPSLSVFLHPYMKLWLMKSLNNMYGLGSCSIILVFSVSFMGSLGGMYMEHIMMVLSRVVLTAMARRLGFRYISLCAI